jgi:hypothetical protein
MGAETLDKIQTVIYLPEKTRYFAGLFVKHMSISLSDFFAECVEAALETVTVSVAGRDFTYAELQEQLWTDHPADRLVLLATRFPGEMTDREALLWRGVICRNKEFWLVPLTGVRIPVSKDTFNYEYLRNKWEDLDSLNRGQIAKLAQSIKVNLEGMKAAILRDMEAAREKGN